jgi:hypothetical protein
MAESAFLAAVAGFLRSRSGLAAAHVGVAEPVVEADLPAVVLSLEEVRRTHGGVVERRQRPPEGEQVTSELEVTRFSGVLRADVCAAAAAEVVGLSAAAVDALVSSAARGEMSGLLWIGLATLGSVGAPDPGAGGARRRTARFRFDYEHEAARPVSEGGVLREIQVDVKGLSADPDAVIEVDLIPRRSQ